MKRITIFYSWQSDLPIDTNQNAIRIALKEAIPKVESDNKNFRLDLDEATQKSPGSPNIISNILQKILLSDIFVADITTINNNCKNCSRKVSNPNVLFELGFALSSLGWNRIILLYNSYFGDFNTDLPFDIDKHRIMKYKIQNINDKNGKGQLTCNLYKSLKSIVESNPIKGFETAISDEQKKRNNDVNNIKRLMSNIHLSTLDTFIDNFPNRIFKESLFFFEGFSNCIKSSNFFIYDKKIKESINKFYLLWDSTLSFGHRFESRSNIDRLVFSPKNAIMTKEEENDYKELQKIQKPFYDAYQELINIIRIEWPEIHIDDLSKSAIIKYNENYKE